MDKKYSYLSGEGMPAIVREGVRLLGTREVIGSGNNPIIVKWADEVEDAMSTPYTRWAADWYNADSIAWCGLFLALIAVRSNPQRLANRLPPPKYLSALDWQNFGIAVPDLRSVIVGDVLVKTRAGGGHVTLCVGVTRNMAGRIVTVHCLGGNQSDSVTIAEYSLDTFSHCRRIPYTVRPAGARQIEVSSSRGTGTIKES